MPLRRQAGGRRMPEIAKAAANAFRQAAMPWPSFGRCKATARASAGRKCQRKFLKSPDSRKDLAAFAADFSLKIASNPHLFARHAPETGAKACQKRFQMRAAFPTTAPVARRKRFNQRASPVSRAGSPRRAVSCRWGQRLRVFISSPCPASPRLSCARVDQEDSRG